MKKKSKTDKNIPGFILIWKWMNIFLIIVNIVIIMFSILKKQYVAKELWLLYPIEFPFLFIILVDAGSFILSILIVYGIVKKSKIGYYSSLASIGYLLFLQIIFLIKPTHIDRFIIDLFLILVYIGIGYLIYENKWYFEGILQKKKKKNPWIAVSLNIIPGLGYLYLGKRKVFSYLLLLFQLIVIIVVFINQPPPLSYTSLSLISIVLFFLAFMCDAFYEAKKTTNETSKNKKKKKKDQWLAAILNIIPGLGYLYLGRRKVFSYLLLSFTLVNFIDGFINPNIELEGLPFIWIGLIISFAFMYDAYDEARE